MTTRTVVRHKYLNQALLDLCFNIFGVRGAVAAYLDGHCLISSTRKMRNVGRFGVETAGCECLKVLFIEPRPIADIPGSGYHVCYPVITVRVSFDSPAHA